MRKIVFVLIVLFFSNIQFSQSKEECFANLSIFAEYAKVKNYKAAYQPWLELKKQCPDLNSAIYVLGERMLKSFIKSSDDTTKLQFQKDLVNLYDEWLQFFPKSKRGVSEVGKILAIKAQTMLDYKLANSAAKVSVNSRSLSKEAEKYEVIKIEVFRRKKCVKRSKKVCHTRKKSWRRKSNQAIPRGRPRGEEFRI